MVFHRYTTAIPSIWKHRLFLVKIVIMISKYFHLCSILSSQIWVMGFSPQLQQNSKSYLFKEFQFDNQKLNFQKVLYLLKKILFIKSSHVIVSSMSIYYTFISLLFPKFQFALFDIFDETKNYMFI